MLKIPRKRFTIGGQTVRVLRVEFPAVGQGIAPRFGCFVHYASEEKIKEIRVARFRAVCHDKIASPHRRLTAQVMGQAAVVETVHWFGVKAAQLFRHVLARTPSRSAVVAVNFPRVGGGRA